MRTIFTCGLLVVSGLLAAQIPAGAVGYWPFDNNAMDMSGHGNNGTASNTIPYKDRFGNPNKAYKFNGSSSSVVVPNSISVDIASNEDFTFAIWEKSYDDNSDRAILAKHVTGSWNGYFFSAYIADQGYCSVSQHITFYTASGYQQDACSDTGIMSDSSWHFLTGVYKASTQSNYFYIDGVLQADTGNSSGVLSDTANLSFGYLYDHINPTNGHYYHGVLDDGRLYKRALSHTEILQLYNEAHSTTGITEWSASNPKLSAYPNPGNGSFLISVNNGNANMQMQVYNAIGELILQQPLSSVNTSIDLSNQASGVYFLKLDSPQGVQTLRLVKE